MYFQDKNLDNLYNMKKNPYNPYNFRVTKKPVHFGHPELYHYLTVPDTPCKDCNARFTTIYPRNLNPIKNMEDTVVFLAGKMFISLNFSTVSYKQEMRRETTNDNE